MSLSSSLKSLLIVCAFATFVFSTVGKNEQLPLSPKDLEGQHILQKGCSSQCQQLAFSATLGDKVTFGYGHQCCNTDNCNQADLQVARKTSDPNGIICPTCYSESDSRFPGVSGALGAIRRWKRKFTGKRDV
ncbi:hypothetical protein P7K49_035238 [Saguinus oedipus]|uniref:Uncharacterized protein n=1 Tax=Saguinus oedipus TaxID=9490 RepID=A0ABQ9TM54_SAGOE|nr:hypothetical protein P7K49_035238 [Saguinus oedipus]